MSGSVPGPRSIDELKVDLLGDATRRATDYILAGEPSAFPSKAAIDGLDGIPSELPAGPTDPNAVLGALDELGSPATVRNTGGRYFGFVTGGSEPVATAAAVLSTIWDQNIALPVMSPTAARIDAIAARWVTELLSLPTGATAAFCAGASIANLTCVLAARDTLLARQGWQVEKAGLAGAPPIEVVTSAEIHVSVLKALRVAGIGSDAVRFIDTDECGRIDGAALGALGPLSLVILQAGNVNTGHSDPFAEIVPLVHEAGGWVHVDGAFGLWAAASPRLAPLLDGVDGADSWATDAHKWLNVTYDAGIAICARGEDLRRAMAVDAAYLDTDSDRALMHLGLQMSQRARAIETWAVIAAKGRSGITAMIESSCDLAERLARSLVDGGAELLAPVGLNQALVAFGDDERTEAVIERVQQGGTIWVGGTTWKGRRAIRLSLSDSSATAADVDAAAQVILRAVAELA